MTNKCQGVLIKKKNNESSDVNIMLHFGHGLFTEINRNLLRAKIQLARIQLHKEREIERETTSCSLIAITTRPILLKLTNIIIYSYTWEIVSVFSTKSDS